MANILAVDIGGTSSRFAHFTVPSSTPQLIGTKWLSTTSASSFKELLNQLESENFSLSLKDADIVVVAAAGPIERGLICTPPNIDWKIDLSCAKRDFGISEFRLINDFVAQAYSCLSPVSSEADTIFSGSPDVESPIAVVGAGTGLGKAALVPNPPFGYKAIPSEGGHVNMACETEREFAFERFVATKMNATYAVWDWVVSGRGLGLVHEFLTGEQIAPEEISAKLKGSETLEWFSKMYARVCRNYVLETMAQGGLFIAGGVAAKNPLILTCATFRETFIDSHTHAGILKKVPIKLLDNQESGLWGGAMVGVQALRR